MITGMIRPRARWMATLFLMAFPLFACNYPAALGMLATNTAEPGESATPTPSRTPPPTATLIPTPSPQEVMEKADTALFNGDWERALAEYQKVLSRSADPNIKGLAQLGMGKTQQLAGRWEEAVETLNGFLDTYPDHPRSAQGYFLRARAYEALGRYKKAAKDYQRYLQLRPDHLDSFVQEHIGDALRLADQPLEAIPHYRAAMNAPRLRGTNGVLLNIGRAYLSAEDPDSALEVFDEVFGLASDPSTKATANYLAGRALLTKGDEQAGYARYLDSVENYPTAYDSYMGLIELVDAGIPVDDFQRGLVDYNAGAYSPALNAFTRHLMRTPTPEGYYYRGLTLRALGDAKSAAHDFASFLGYYPDDPLRTAVWLEKARTEWAYLGDYSRGIQTYLNFVAERPEDSKAPEALFAAGSVAERSDQLDLAAEIWLRIPEEYPGSELAYQGGFEAGIADYRRGEFEASRDAFRLVDGFASESGKHAALELWIGKTYQAQGQAELAREAWERAEGADPTGYYSLRAADLLAGREAFKAQGELDFSLDMEKERQEAEEWLRATFGIESQMPLDGLSPELASDERMVRGREYWDLGLYREAGEEFEALRKDIQDDPEATYRFMHQMLDLRLYRSAIYAARQILRLAGMEDGETLNAPLYFNHIRFGPYFADLILNEAIGRGLEGLFVLSVARQESLFESFATSYASARGLMQIVPATGQEIANKLGWPPGYTDDDLYRPIVSVRFGTYYLAQQKDYFEGDLVAALAAYNGGPGNTITWKNLAPDDPDLFLEVIRLPQSHRYIQVIYEAFSLYQRLYANHPGG